jgi:hypothetical protein
LDLSLQAEKQVYTCIPPSHHCIFGQSFLVELPSIVIIERQTTTSFHRRSVMQFSSEALNDLLLLLSGASAVIWPTVIAAALYLLESEREESERATTQIKINRCRISVLEVYTSMGPRVFRRAFRMKFDSFWHLYSILSTHISTATLEGRNYVPKGGRDGGNYSLPPIPNGEIPSNVRLGAAICYFAGGSPYDIMCVFGISYSEVLMSVWIVVEAIHKCPQFEISYPEGVEEQREIAAGFEAASTPGIRNCAGAIDDILIWMLKPSLKQAEKSGVDQKKFLCGRKHKFGLNCQSLTVAVGFLTFQSSMGVRRWIALPLKQVTCIGGSKRV